MLNYFILLLGCQFLGEVTVRFLHLPFPGPVVGMLMLFIYLIINQGVPKQLEDVSQVLLKHLSLFFVPAGVGVMAHFELLKTDAWPLIIAIIVSTAVGIVVTGLVMGAMLKPEASTSDQTERSE